MSYIAKGSNLRFPLHAVISLVSFNNLVSLNNFSLSLFFITLKITGGLFSRMSFSLHWSDVLSWLNSDYASLQEYHRSDVMVSSHSFTWHISVSLITGGAYLDHLLRRHLPASLCKVALSLP